MPLIDLLRERIRTHGPITVAEYMQACLTHPEFGYYTRENEKFGASIFGQGGDFTTAPEISQIFGEMLGAFLADGWQRQGKKKSILVELGPGRGTLMRDLLRATHNVRGFHEALDIRMVEISPSLRAKQQDILAGAHPCIGWADAFEPLPEMPLLLVANEFFDALPVHQWVGDAEVMVGLDDQDNLAFVIPGKNGTKQMREISPAGIAIMQSVAKHIAQHGGIALIADYGYTHGNGDTLQAVKAHNYHPVLETPGEADLTAHVDFNALAHAAKEAGAQTECITQAQFLRRCGAELRAAQLCRNVNAAQQKIILSGLERLMSPAQMGELFKVMTVVPVNVTPSS